MCRGGSPPDAKWQNVVVNISKIMLRVESRSRYIKWDGGPIIMRNLHGGGDARDDGNRDDHFYTTWRKEL